jgi:ABC-type multidrug transport system ATPase subunit
MDDNDASHSGKADDLVERSSISRPKSMAVDRSRDGEQGSRTSVPAAGAAAAATLSMTRTGRLSFHDREVHIPPNPKGMTTTTTTAAGTTTTTAVASSQARPGKPSDLPSSPEATPASSCTNVTIDDNINTRKSVILKSLQSMIGGGSFRTDYTVGQLSLSNTINVSAHSKMDMSMFQTKKNGSWATRGVTLATDNLSYFVKKQKGSWWSRHFVGNAKTTTTPTPSNNGTGTTAPPSMTNSSATTCKALLKHVTMTVLPGEVAFVMGPSGAGKSTLLDALAGRIKNGIMSGHMYFNGRPRDAGFYANSAYVRQNDVHIPNLTVEETLYFAARLRLGEEYTDNERHLRVNAVSDLLGLKTCLISMVGDAGIRGISGGQLKRLSIAVEIMNMPSLIFLDEPTSGLDSVMAHDVMTFTNRLADQNRTILATIHQPSSDTFALASKVILVTAGRVAFCGPASEAQAYFTSPRLGFSAATYTNPADFIIAVVSGAEASTNLIMGAHNTDAKKLSELYESSVYFQAPLINAPSTTDGGLARLPQHFPTSTTNQVLTLIRRFWIAQSRQWEFVVAQLGKNIIVASVCGAIFFGQGREISAPTFTNVSFNVSSLWYFAMLYTVLSCLQIIPHLFFYKVLYIRERSANVYSTFAYWAANAIVSVPLLMLSHVVFVEISYWMVGLYPNASCHFFALFVTFLNNLISFYCAQYIAAVSPSAEVALAMFPLVFLFLGSFAGFTIPLGELPAGRFLVLPNIVAKRMEHCVDV